MALFCASARRGAASRARLPWQLRLRRRRAIDAAGTTPQPGLAAGLSAWSTSSSLLGDGKELLRKLEAEVMAGERRTHEVVVRNGELEGNCSSSNSEFVPQKPLPCMLYFLSGRLLCPTLRTQVSAPWRPISTARHHRPRDIPRQARQYGQSAPRGVASTSELAARSDICDRFHPSSLSFSALTRRSPALCARVQAASGSASAR